MEEFKKNIKGKTILISGGTGSFGNSVIKTLLEFSPQRVIIFSRDEKKQFDMRNQYNDPILKFIIGDVRDRDRIENVIRQNKIDYIFHAAALKQVPACEFFPLEAVKTNIFGAHNVIQSAIKNQVKRVVILSTDKAVYPINAMGMSKAIMEKVMIAAARELNETKNKNTVLCGVRYGNVLYSRGSVLPYFVSLIKQNKKLTVTNFQMTRFLLPLPEAVKLVLYALIFGNNGNLYVKKSPACTLETLAKAVCEIFHYQKGYKEVGIRAGEKMHETLVTKEELSRAADLGNYYQIPPESQGLDYNQYFTRGKRSTLNKIQAYTSENTERLDTEKTKKLLLGLAEIQKELTEYKKR